MISIKNLNFKHGRKQENLFENLNCIIEPGNIVGLLGKNGAGKTTLLKILTGLLHPEKGEITISEHQPIKRKPSFLKEIYFVSEEFELPAISSNAFLNSNSGFYPSFDHGLFKKLITEFELNPVKNLQKYSYGQKKKFLISFALATRCKILVMDEPTNGLDIPSKSVFRKVLAGSLDEEQMVIISTHQVKDVENLIDRILLLDHGKFILENDLYEISSVLNFKYSSTTDSPDVLYSELVPGGYKIITSERNVHTSVDIELLFNAITKGNLNIKDHINE